MASIYKKNFSKMNEIQRAQFSADVRKVHSIYEKTKTGNTLCESEKFKKEMYCKTVTESLKKRAKVVDNRPYGKIIQELYDLVTS